MKKSGVMNPKPSTALMLLTACGLIVGCSSSRPDHCANWWYYWTDGAVVDDMDRVKYLWQQPPEVVGVSSPHKTTNLVALSDLVLNPSPPLVAHHKFTYQAVVIGVQFDGGVDVAAATIAHEFKHVWVYQQWGARIGQTGTVNGLHHEDKDAIPDIIEQDRNLGSIGATYDLLYWDADTYDLGSLPGWSVYGDYGDNELLARVEEVSNPRARRPADDWSRDGKNWGK